MPRLDACEPQIVRALAKSGWHVVTKQYALRTGKARRYVYADLLLKDAETLQKTIVIEVKCFPVPQTIIEEFHRAYGQYHMYRKAMEKNSIKAPLYLAIPAPAYTELISDPLIKEMLEEDKIKRIIVDIEQEEILEWID